MSGVRKPPILREGGLSEQVYIVTSYTERLAADGSTVAVANTKFDVTEQFNAIVAARLARAAKETNE